MWFADDFQHPLGAGAGVLQNVGELPNRADAVSDGHQVENDFGQIADGHLALDDLPSAHPENERHAQAKDELGKGHARGPVIHGLEHGAEEEVLALAELGNLSGFFGECAHDARPRDVLLNHGGHRAVEVVDMTPLGLEFAGVKGNQGDGGKHGCKR